MKKNRFSEEQIIRILKEAEPGGKETQELSRHHGHYRTNLLPLASEIRGHERLRSPPGSGNWKKRTPTWGQRIKLAMENKKGFDCSQKPKKPD